MVDLKELRDEIDVIDRQMVDLFEQRMELCQQVAEYKINTGKKVFDRSRETAKLDTLKGLTHNEFNRHGVEELFQQIMAMSRKLQYQLLAQNGVVGRLPFIAVDEIERSKVRVVFQGVEGAYSQAAMKQFFTGEITSFHVEQWRDAMEAIAEGSADFAVLPIENSTAGSVNDMYDLLVEFENYIVGEQIIRCEHRLLGLPGTELSDIRRVYSHPQGLSQCKPFLEEHRDWKQIPMENTAVAAKRVAEDGDKSQAAIASAFAGERFGLQVLADRIYVNEANSTRFIIVTNQRVFRKDADKISICFELPHTSGSLYNMLSHFIYNNINMTKIESRPITGRNWEYRFFIDFEGNLNDSSVKNALRGIREEARNMKILGNY
ncbi:MAG: prephenate dehydratase [Blautia sp.]|nr:prephenate dehydratase [Blautia sp.]MDY4516730.1 prephenate dehydratase [Lachnospiraceae bacterium]